ncbi:hypothetical protein Agub_g8316, partial [Astrephomene gubernaculifera]
GHHRVGVFRLEMDITDRINLLPDAVRRQILHAICGTTGHQPEHDDPNTKDTATHINSYGPSNASSRADAPSPARLDIACEIKLVGGACIIDNFISTEEVTAARECARQALKEGQHQAAIGGAVPQPGEGRQVDEKARGDVVVWLNPEREAAAGRGPMAALLGRLEAVRQHLERQGWDVVGRPRFQLACYPGAGARYVRHADASPTCPSRRVTAIVYLNEPDWQPQTDGGCLALYSAPHHHHHPHPNHPNHPSLRGAGLAAGEPALLVAPVGGRLLLFESHLQHEVMPAYRHRYAVTAWFHCRNPHAPTPPASGDTPGISNSSNGNMNGSSNGISTNHPSPPA